jgi:hypothetical protein
MKLIKLLQFISYYQGEVVGHKRKRKEKRKNQEKNIRNQKQNKKKWERAWKLVRLIDLEH